MRGERMALVAGWDDTRAAFGRWNRDVSGVVRVWMGTSLAIGVALLLATWGIGTWVAPEPATAFHTFSGDPDFRGAVHVFTRNFLVLAMHALICVAGYMATVSVAHAAEDYTGWTRRAHLAAKPITFAFILAVTIGSFALQAWTLGSFAPAVARAYDVPVGELLLLLTPHAVPELVAVFLPLGAWLVLARRRAYGELLAASILASAVALPILVAAALVEEYVTPLVVAAAAG